VQPADNEKLNLPLTQYSGDAALQEQLK